MIDHVVVSAILAPALLVLAMLVMVDRQHPGPTAVTFVFSALLVAVSSLVSLAAVSVEAGMILAGGDLPGLPHLGTVVFLLLVTAAIGAGVWRERRSLRAARAQAAALPGDDVVVLLPAEEPAAFTLPGRPGRIVVTQGMVGALSAADRAVVMARERAHLAGHHHRWLLAGRLAVAAHPLLWRAARIFPYLMERWADERAAEQVGDRRATARAIGAAALVAGADPAPGALPLLTERGPGSVPRRIAALLSPLPGGQGALMLAVPLLVAVGPGVWSAEAIVDVMQAGGPCTEKNER
ncbi:hypothetical protein Acor_44480 [Acrocarpospora corrugata]|uniref:Peptidase M48 domain-containing protein n=1 Tax=Acrocarpospora corrugata TaxID=35763 RepID=A0A5M3W2Y4_9ACTN|nr:M56 family metallopeptidase [Acrocarpospora corrugata]GES02382.1 hypothetical protein Acor_44480 [Acrocarpospora corrugata]